MNRAWTPRRTNESHLRPAGFLCCAEGASIDFVNGLLSWALAIFGEAELWSVEYNVIHDTGVERGAIDSGGKAWIVANMLLIGMSAGGDVG